VLGRELIKAQPEANGSGHDGEVKRLHHFRNWALTEAIASRQGERTIQQLESDAGLRSRIAEERVQYAQLTTMVRLPFANLALPGNADRGGIREEAPLGARHHPDRRALDNRFAGARDASQSVQH